MDLNNTLQERNENNELINITNLYLNTEVFQQNIYKEEIIYFNNLNFKILAKYQDNTYTHVNLKLGTFKSIIDNVIYLAYYIDENTERYYLFNSIEIFRLLEYAIEQSPNMLIDKKRVFLTDNFDLINSDLTKFDEKILIKKRYIIGRHVDSFPIDNNSEENPPINLDN